MKVITIYGSKSDLPFMEPAREYLKENDAKREMDKAMKRYK